MRRRHFTLAGEIVIAGVDLRSPSSWPLFGAFLEAERPLDAPVAIGKMGVGSAQDNGYATAAKLGYSLQRPVNVAIGGSRTPAMSGRWGPAYATP